MDYSEFSKWSAALCCWREARGEGTDGMRAVCWVIKNRSKGKGKPWPVIIYAPLQFSSMSAPHDPQLSTVPLAFDPEFEQAYVIADRIFGGGDSDLTNGATHYFAEYIPMPTWALGMKETAKIGKHTFYQEAS